MNEDRKAITWAMVILLVLGGLLTWGSYRQADRAVNAAYAPFQAGIRQYNATTRGAHIRPLNAQDMFSAFHANGQMFPKRMKAGRPCGSDCIAQDAVKAAKLGPVPVLWSGGAGLLALMFGVLFGFTVFSPNPRKNPINYGRERIRLRNPAADLPVIQGDYGLKRSNPAEGRAEYGSIAFFGKSGRGKSNLIKWWLLTNRVLNFIVVDLKGELFELTAGYRATVGEVLRLDLTSMEGDAIDPLDTDHFLTAQTVIQSFLPYKPDDAKGYFNKAAQKVALAFWRVARATGQSAMVVLVEAANKSNAGMVQMAQRLTESCPPDVQSAALEDFQAGFGNLWDDPNAAGERGSVVESFKAAFSPLAAPEILSTLCRTTFNPADLVEGRATLYITAPTTEPPYKVPLEHLIGGVVEAIRQYVTLERGNKQGQDIMILADEAGNLRIPDFERILTLGRSSGLNMAAFFQTMGQLNKYAEKGNWKALANAFHHWAFWWGDDEDADSFMRDKAGKYDKPNPSRDPEERKRRPFIEVSAYDEIRPRWKAKQLIASFDFDRRYVVFGLAVDPYPRWWEFWKGKARQVNRLMNLEPPEMVRLPAIPAVRYSTSQTKATPLTPANLPRKKATPPSTRATSGHNQGDEAQTPAAATTAPTRPPAPNPTPARKAPPVFDDSDDEETF